METSTSNKDGSEVEKIHSDRDSPSEVCLKEIKINEENIDISNPGPSFSSSSSTIRKELESFTIKQEEITIKDENSEEEISGSSTVYSTPPKRQLYVYQFNVSLKGLKPKIWRRIQVPDFYCFRQLHWAIQKCMGWSNKHTHLFYLKNPLTGLNEIIAAEFFTFHNEFYYLDDDSNVVNEITAKIADYFKIAKDKSEYQYNVSDTWKLDIVLEKIVPVTMGVKYPRCLAGRNYPPPEDHSDGENKEWKTKWFHPSSIDFSASLSHL